MPVLSGVNQQFVFGGITFNSASCIQSAGIDTSLDLPTYICSGVKKYVIGPKSFTFTYSLALSATHDSYVSALDLGSTSTLSWFPAGTTSGYVKFTSTRGIAQRQNISSPVNGVVTVDGSISLDDLTIATSTGG